MQVLGNISCDLDYKIKGQIMHFLVNASTLYTVGSSNRTLCLCYDHTMWRAPVNIWCEEAKGTKYERGQRSGIDTIKYHT